MTFDLSGRVLEIARFITNYNFPCLEKGEEHAKKNEDCLSYYEAYKENDTIYYAYENIFDSEGNFLETKYLPYLTGYKKWKLLDGIFTFAEKMEFPEKQTETNEFETLETTPLFTEANYTITFPNPKGNESKRKVVLHLDYLYRPVGIIFVVVGKSYSILTSRTFDPLGG